MLDKNIIVSLDDILIFTKTKEKYSRVIADIFRRLARHSLFDIEEKCALFLKQVEFLGHIVTDKGISAQASEVEAVRNWPQPTTVPELQQLLGFYTYYRKFD